MLKIMSLLSILGLFAWGQPASADAFDLSYSGRLTQADGKPLAGEVDLVLKFYDVPTGGVATVTKPINDVLLSQGGFTVPMGLSAAERALVFDGGEVWIEVVRGSVVYPRQKFLAVPYALKMPIDEDLFKFDTDGKLAFKVDPVANRVLGADGTGALTWVDLTGSGLGDMLAGTWDGNSNSKIDAADHADDADELGGQLPAFYTNAGNIPETATRKWLSDTERTKLAGITAGADMLKSTYDTNNDGKVNSAVAADTAVNATQLNGQAASYYLDATNLTGTIDDARIPAAIARDAELPTAASIATAFAADAVSGNKVDGGTISNFASTGIDDNSDSLAMTIDSSENVGIGTATPASPLQVVGDGGASLTTVLFDRAYPTDGNTPRTPLTLQRTYTAGPGADGIGSSIAFKVETETEGVTANIGSIRAVTTDATAGTIDSYLGLGATANSINGLDLLVVQGDGKVGVGTTTPSTKLSVAGGDISLDSNALRSISWGVGTGQPQIKNTGNASLGIWASEPTLSGYTMPAIGIDNFHISTFTSQASIDGQTAFVFDNAPALTSTSTLLSLRQAGAARVTVLAGGNVGVGTTTPGATLDVQGTSGYQAALGMTNGAARIYELTNNVDTVPPVPVLTVVRNGKSGSSYANVLNLNMSRYSAAGLSPFTQLDFKLNANTNEPDVNVMTMRDNGNVGIGTAAPTAKLHVAGVAGTDGIKFPDGTLQTTAATPMLTANRTYYVRTDGSDSNDGLANTVGGAFLTIQKAVDTIANINLGGYSVTIQLADGTYSGTTYLASNWIGKGTVTLNGNSTTPANVVLTSASNTLVADNGSNLSVSNLELRSTVNACAFAQNNGVIVFGAGVRFGACVGYHMAAAHGGGIYAAANYSIVGSAAAHAYALNEGRISVVGVTITLSGTPAFSSSFASAARSGLIEFHANTFSGAATGPRYFATTLGNIFVNGGGANYFPGNSAGGVATGGQYN